MMKLIDTLRLRESLPPPADLRRPHGAGRSDFADAASEKVVSLSGPEVWSSGTRAERLRVCVQAGIVWLTESCEATDVVLRPGQSFLTRGGKVVLQTLGDKTARVVISTRPPLY